MNCSYCGAPIEDGQETCPACFAQLPRPGLLRRLVAWFQARFCRPRIVPVRRTEKIEVLNQTTGERQVFDSLEDLPADVRAKLEALRESVVKAAIERARSDPQAFETPSGKASKIQFKSTVKSFACTYRDAAGHERTFHSVDEMPADVRAIYEKVALPEMHATTEAPDTTEANATEPAE